MKRTIVLAYLAGAIVVTTYKVNLMARGVAYPPPIPTSNPMLAYLQSVAFWPYDVVRILMYELKGK